MKNPWELPPHAARGDRIPTPLYIAIGQAMSAWEFIEFDLSEMFAIFTGSGRTNKRGQDPAVRAYGTVVSYRGRSELLNAAAKAFFKRNGRTRLERPFKNILKKCNGWADRRNDVAHGVVLKVPTLTKGYCLYPSPYNARKYSLDEAKGAFRYRASQIRKFVTAFRKLRRQTGKLVDRLDAEMVRRRKLQAQLAEQLRQVREMYSRRAQGQNDQQ
jgi:hypothetical protein